ncbi:MAG TPA: hypothetical protein VGQ76_12785 [Thermoanaerobaculia bacterium]|nr:hypothetical protein [Thermoanaerobaculia bacterium]
MIPHMWCGVGETQHVQAIQPDVRLGFDRAEATDEAKGRAVRKLVDVADGADWLAGIII